MRIGAGLPMLFNSYIFIFLFLPVTVGGWYLLHKTGKAWLPKWFLLGMSLWFYGYFNVRYLPIIIGSVLLNYALSHLLRRTERKALRRLLLIAGITVNIGVLFYYKYLDFCVDNVNAIFHTDFALRHLLLPLGISFFTFQQVSFVVDSYKRETPRYSFLDYALFVTFFPQLIAGPIVLHSEIVPQFADPDCGKWNSENIAKGILAFTFGLAKKVLLADAFGRIVEYGFGNIPKLDSTGAVISMLAYTLQIYFDFSGYCDMATGLGKFFNIDIPQNFRSPYRALDMDDFWKRWHITLTRFLRSNVYFPLGGSRKGAVRTYVNIFIVFLVSGIWHGANWTFVLWGAVNGAAVIVSKLFSAQLKKAEKYWKIPMWMATFLFINLSWILFRADSIPLAAQMIRTIFSLRFGAVPSAFYTALQTGEFGMVAWVLEKVSADLSHWYVKGLLFAALGFGTYASVGMKNTNERLEQFRPTARRCVLCIVLFVWSVLALSGVSTFLYFNF